MKRILSLILVLVMILGLTGCDSAAYKKAMELFEAGNYVEAKAIFSELRDYKDSAERIIDCDNGILYENASAAYADGKYATAIALFKKLGDYSDSTEKVKECYIAMHGKDAYDFISSLEVGDTVEYGTFEQDNNENTVDEKILWHVIDRQGESVLLLSDKILWYGYYSDESAFTNNSNWADSLFYDWLNSAFYVSAFTDEEQQLILRNNPSYRGNVFLLSAEEARNLPGSILKCTDTAYAWGNRKSSGGKYYRNIWALRTLVMNYNGWDCGILSYLVTTENGRIYEENNDDFKAGESGFPCGNSSCFIGIRPAIWISLDA